MPLLSRSILDAKTNRLDSKTKMYQGTERIIDEEVLFEKLVGMLIKALAQGRFSGHVDSAQP